MSNTEKKKIGEKEVAGSTVINVHVILPCMALYPAIRYLLATVHDSQQIVRGHAGYGELVGAGGHQGPAHRNITLAKNIMFLYLSSVIAKQSQISLLTASSTSSPVSSIAFISRHSLNTGSRYFCSFSSTSSAELCLSACLETLRN